MKKFLVVMSYLALVSSLWAADFSLNPARDFGAIRRINPTDYDGKSVVREDGTGLSSDTVAAFRAALEVFSKVEVEPAGAVATHDALTAVHGVSEVADAADLSAHVTDNSDIHGCTVIASASAVADALSAANASDALLLPLDGSRAMTGSLKFSDNYGIFAKTTDDTDNKRLIFGGGGSNAVARGSFIESYGNEYATYGGATLYYAGNVSTGDHRFYTGAGTERFRIGYDGTSKITGSLNIIYPSGSPQLTLERTGSSTGKWTFAASANSLLISDAAAAAERMRITSTGNVLVGTTTDDGTNKLQVNGPVYVASYVSALGYIDRTEAPDTLAEAYAIVQSHDVTADGELDHSKLHPAAWGKRVELRPTGNTITRTIEKPIQDAEQLKDGSLFVKEKIIEEPEMEQIVVPDQSGRDLSMVISAQALVIKDLTKRIEALEATR